MPEDQIQPFMETLSLYTSFFFMLIIVSFVIFIVVLILLVRNVKTKKNLSKNKSFLAETIAVQEEERRRISQELHDTVSQNIKALLLLQKECEEMAQDVSQPLQEQVQKIITLEKQNQKQLRSIIQNLAVPALKDVPFKSVISDLCEQFTSQSQIPCNFFVAPEVDLENFSLEERHHILRIIQEALNNARIHAKPEETGVVIRRNEDKIRIMIFDDGTGFPATEPDGTLPYIEGQTHFGLTGMEMRAALLGGTLTVQSSKDTGTEIRVELPANWD